MELTRIKMEFEELGAFWSPAFEADSFNTFASDSLSDGATHSSATENRRKLASELLEFLEVSQKQLSDEPYNGWLEEPMDLEVFGQSLMDCTPLEEANTSFLSAPSSPLQPSTPIHPASPQGLYPSQDELPAVKFDLNSWECLLSETESSPLGSPETSQHDDDVTAVLLESLINGEVAEDQIVEELADFSLAFIESTVDHAAVSQLTNVPTPSSCSSSESEDAWSPRPQKKSSETALRKPRRRSLKVEDRRMRKKEQNKTAATRYRIKKKAELEILLEEEAELLEKNKHLQAHHDELATEVRYLKKLMREVFRGRK